MRVHDLSSTADSDPYAWWQVDREFMRCFHGTRSAFLPDIKRIGVRPPDEEIRVYTERLIRQYFPTQNVPKDLYDKIHTDIDQFRNRADHISGVKVGPVIYCFPAPHWENAAGYAKSYAQDGGEISHQMRRIIDVWNPANGLDKIPRLYPQGFPVVLELLVPRSRIANISYFKEVLKRITKVNTNLTPEMKQEVIDLGLAREVWVTKTIAPSQIVKVWKIKELDQHGQKAGFWDHEREPMDESIRWPRFVTSKTPPLTEEGVWSSGGFWVKPTGALLDLDHDRGMHHKEVAQREFEFKLTERESFHNAMNAGWIRAGWWRNQNTNRSELDIEWSRRPTTHGLKSLVEQINRMPEFQSYLVNNNTYSTRMDFMYQLQQEFALAESAVRPIVVFMEELGKVAPVTEMGDSDYFVSPAPRGLMAVADETRSRTISIASLKAIEPKGGQHILRLACQIADRLKITLSVHASPVQTQWREPGTLEDLETFYSGFGFRPDPSMKDDWDWNGSHMIRRPKR